MTQDAQTPSKLTHSIIVDRINHLTDQAVASLVDLQNLKRTIRHIR